tara:strand:- start:820 stop:1287 length:468 start_codon:yes stop_codon:yes gene_type:complete
MIYIAHRGNIRGALPERENHPDYITEALKKDFNVEVDVWYEDKSWVLGHDAPQYEISLHFLYNRFLWCHAKNIEALKEMSTRGIHCFWHQSDDVTLTSQGYLWTYPGKLLTTKSICVNPETIKNQDVDICAGICSDYIEDYRAGSVKNSLPIIRK